MFKINEDTVVGMASILFRVTGRIRAVSVIPIGLAGVVFDIK